MAYFSRNFVVKQSFKSTRYRKSVFAKIHVPCMHIHEQDKIPLYQDILSSQVSKGLSQVQLIFNLVRNKHRLRSKYGGFGIKKRIFSVFL